MQEVIHWDNKERTNMSLVDKCRVLIGAGNTIVQICVISCDSNSHCNEAIIIVIPGG